MRGIDCTLREVRLSERRKFDRTVTIVARARFNALDAQNIDDVAAMLNCTRNEFILSAATSLAQAYINQRKGDQTTLSIRELASTGDYSIAELMKIEADRNTESDLTD